MEYTLFLEDLCTLIFDALEKTSEEAYAHCHIVNASSKEEAAKKVAGRLEKLFFDELVQD